MGKQATAIVSPTEPAGPARFTYREVFEKFLELETGLGLFDQRIGDAYFWEYIRLYVHNDVLRKLRLMAVEPFHPNRSLGERGRRLFEAAWGSIARNPYLATPKDVLFFSSPRRTLGANGNWWDLHIDPLLASMRHSHLYLERLHCDGRRRPAETRSLRYHDCISLLSYLRRKLAPLILTQTDRALIGKIEASLRDAFGTRIDVLDIVTTLLHARASLLPFYQGLFERVRPKLVVFVSVNCPERTALEACKNLGIASAELQHGVFGEYDLSYAFPKPPTPIRFFPDHVLVHGSYWKEAIRHPPAGTKITSIGFSHLETERRARAGQDAGDRLLFVSQPTVGEELSRFAAGVAQRPEFAGKVVYRLHPNERRWRESYPCLIDANVEVECGADCSLYDSFARSHAQVGVYSAALFEGLAFGLKTYVVDLPGVEFVDRLIDAGTVELVREPYEIASERQPKSLANVDSLYRSGATANFETFLRTTIGDG